MDTYVEVANEEAWILPAQIKELYEALVARNVPMNEPCKMAVRMQTPTLGQASMVIMFPEYVDKFPDLSPGEGYACTMFKVTLINLGRWTEIHLAQELKEMYDDEVEE